MPEGVFCCAMCGRQKAKDYTDFQHKQKLERMPWTCSTACRERLLHLLSARQVAAAKAQWRGVPIAERRQKMSDLAKAKWAQIKARKGVASLCDTVSRGAD
jgi:hypothetical protein